MKGNEYWDAPIFHWTMIVGGRVSFYDALQELGCDQLLMRKKLLGHIQRLKLEANPNRSEPIVPRCFREWFQSVSVLLFFSFGGGVASNLSYNTFDYERLKYHNQSAFRIFFLGRLSHTLDYRLWDERPSTGDSDLLFVFWFWQRQLWRHSVLVWRDQSVCGWHQFLPKTDQIPKSENSLVCARPILNDFEVASFNSLLKRHSHNHFGYPLNATPSQEIATP